MNCTILFIANDQPAGLVGVVLRKKETQNKEKNEIICLQNLIPYLCNFSFSENLGHLG